MRFRGRTSLAAGTAAVAVLAGMVAVTGPSAAASPAAMAPVVLSADAPAPVPARAVLLGAAPAQATVSLQVAFKERNGPALDALLAGVANRKSPYFGRFLTPAQFGQLFGPTSAQLSEVESLLRAAGLHLGAVPADRLDLPVTGTVATAERAFGVRLTQYRLPGGQVAFRAAAAPRVPAVIAPLIESIVGLDNLAVPVPYVQRSAVPATTGPATTGTTTDAVVSAPAAVAAKGPQPCSTAKVAAIIDHTYTADQLAGHYGLTPLYAAGDLGQGIRIGLPDLDPFQASDIKAFDACYHITTKYTITTVISGVGTGHGEGEAANDLENISSLAPAATIDLYQAPSTVGDLYAALKVIANENRDRVVAIPYGVCEHELPQADIAAFQSQVTAGASFGQTWIAASGDKGTTGCFGDGKPADAKLMSVDTPASASYLLAVGGTSVSSAVPLSAESAWNSSAAGKAGGASGGGLSSQCMPVYQATNQVNPSAPPVIPGLFTQAKKASKCLSKNDPKGYVREVPDLSADADYHTGYTFYWNSTWNFEWGGTSNSATLVAAETALIDSSPFCGKNGWQSLQLAMYPSLVYAIANQFEPSIYQSSPPGGLYSPSRGNNDYTPSGLKNGKYKAVKGFNLATGLGVPLVTGVGYVAEISNPGMAAYMCAGMRNKNFPSVSTTSVSPGTIRAGKTVTVTVHGSGMLLLKNTDWAIVFYRGSDLRLHPLYGHTVTCSTRSSCTLTLPGAYIKKAQTVYVELEPEFIGCNGNKCKSPTAPLKIVK